MNAREYLEKNKVEIVEEIDARKDKIDADRAWDRLKGAALISVGKGRKYQQWSPGQGNREEILGNAIGRSGNLRAPALKIGDRYVIGYNEEMYDSEL